MAKYEWTTEKGANIVLDIREAGEECINEIDSDGDKVQVKAIRRQPEIARFAVNGKEYNGSLSSDRVEFWVGTRRAAAILPKEIANTIWAPAHKITDVANAAYIRGYDERRRIERGMATGRFESR